MVNGKWRRWRRSVAQVGRQGRPARFVAARDGGVSERLPVAGAHADAKEADPDDGAVRRSGLV